MKLNILITDDEPLAIQKIVGFLKGDERFVIETASNGLECLEKISSFAPDILFLDIQMPELTGFDVLSQVPERRYRIIFQTAYDEFAIQAFDENACDYLLKPFTRDRFDRALLRAMAETSALHNVDRLESALREKKQFLERLVCKTGRKQKIVKAADIVLLSSEDHCTILKSIDGTESICDLSLSQLEAKLDPTRFRRVHRKHVIALEHLRAIEGGENMICELEGGLMVPISRRNRGIEMELRSNQSRNSIRRLV